MKINKDEIIKYIKSNHSGWNVYSNDNEIIVIGIASWISIPTSLIVDLMYKCQINSDNIDITCSKATIPCSNDISVTIKIKI